MNILEQMLNAADWIMFTIKDYEVYGNIVKFLSICIGNFYIWQTVATIGFCNCLRWLAAKLPPLIITIDVGPIDVGPNMEQLLEEKENSLKDAASKNDDLDKKNDGLHAKVNRLQKEVDFISNDRYALVREKCVLQNKLGDFNSWPEFRVECDELATQYEAMKRQRVREQISHEQILQVAKEAKLQLAAAKRAEAVSKTAHSKELKLVKRERDDAREKCQTILSTTSTATTGGNSPKKIALQKKNTRQTPALRSQTSLLTKKTSEFERIQSLIKTRSDQSASKLKPATSTILSLKEDKANADKHIAELEEAVQEANEKAEEMEEMHMAVAFMGQAEDEGEKEGKGEDEEENPSGGEERPPTPWLLEQVVAINKKMRSEAGATGGGSGVDGGWNEDDSEHEDCEEENSEDEEGEDEEGEDEEGEDEDRGRKILEENEDLFKDMMGLPWRGPGI